MNSWPSERVASGGLFHLPKVTYSKETHALLKRKLISQAKYLLCKNAWVSKKYLLVIILVSFALKVLMDEQKMSILQRSRINDYLQRGASLPKPTPLRMNMTKCRPNVDFLRARIAKRRTLNAIKASGALDNEKWALIWLPACISYWIFFCSGIIQNQQHVRHARRRKFDCRLKWVASKPSMNSIAIRSCWKNQMKLATKSIQLANVNYILNLSTIQS